VRFLLDTCVLSELVKPKPDANVVDWVGRQDEHNLFLSVITIGELRKGIAKLPPGSKRSRLERWVAEELAARFRQRVIPVESRVASAWGVILGEAESRGEKIPVIDALIGSSAIVHGCTVATRNVSDLDRTGADVISPWGQ
jgi:predicted nucleic acid-binding protein